MRPVGQKIRGAQRQQSAMQCCTRTSFKCKVSVKKIVARDSIEKGDGLEDEFANLSSITEGDNMLSGQCQGQSMGPIYVCSAPS